MTQPPRPRILRIVRRYFIWLMIVSYLLAATVPGLGIWVCSLAFGRAGAGISLPSLMLAALLFNAGLEVKAAELTGLFQKPSFLVIGFIANAAVPVLFIVAVSLALRPWHNPEEGQQILTGLALVAAVPIAGASTAWVQNCGGNLALSIGLVLFTTVLSPL